MLRPADGRANPRIFNSRLVRGTVLPSAGIAFGVLKTIWISDVLMELGRFERTF